jgi:uncharacterized protein YacL
MHSILIAAAAALVFVAVEFLIRRSDAIRLRGAAIGMLGGLAAFWLLHPAISALSTPAVLVSAILLAYVGGRVGASVDTLPSNPVVTSEKRICDTSVIIDGRLADICETGFIEGTLIVPQFVLLELQHVADSADSARRQRGRRGLDILKRLQSIPNVRVELSEEDPPAPDVDTKLIELARAIQAKILTNDFNLNKVAKVRGVEVLNINELANSLRPVVLPGENMRVVILKEGKEQNQGIAYLDDGTMVVVDNARRYISKTIDITVTSVLQTTAGKMIFGRYDGQQTSAERAERVTPAGA